MFSSLHVVSELDNVFDYNVSSEYLRKKRFKLSRDLKHTSQLPTSLLIASELHILAIPHRNHVSHSISCQQLQLLQKPVI